MKHDYIKVTDELPTPNTEVWSFNGETEIKNKHDGNRWVYELKYPTTHWKYRSPVPSFDEVREVREELAVLST